MKSSVVMKTWVLLSVLMSIWLIKDTWHWAIFVVGGLAIAMCLYFAGLNVIHAASDIKVKDYKNTFKHAAFTVLLIIIVGAVWIVSIGSGIFTGYPVPHLRANILTSECSLNQWTDQADPWFYRLGCNVPTDEKIELLKNDTRFDFIKKQCESKSNNDRFVQSFLTWDEVTCADLIN
jgi:hypothetical protein